MVSNSMRALASSGVGRIGVSHTTALSDTPLLNNWLCPGFSVLNVVSARDLPVVSWISSAA